MFKMTANLMVNNVQETIKFYEELLGFNFVMGAPADKQEIIMENDVKRDLLYVLMKNESVEISFQVKESLALDIDFFSAKNPGASVSFYFEVGDVNKMYEKLKSKVNIVKDVYITWYGMKEFYFLDCNGYVLGIAQRDEV